MTQTLTLSSAAAASSASAIRVNKALFSALRACGRLSVSCSTRPWRWIISSLMPSPRVKVDHHVAAGGQRTAAQHVTRRQLIRFEAIVGGHRHFAAQHFAFTGGAHPALAGKRQVCPRRNAASRMLSSSALRAISRSRPSRRMVTVRPSACTPAARLTLPPGVLKRSR